jgi:hypothetical protein
MLTYVAENGQPRQSVVKVVHEERFELSEAEYNPFPRV